MPTEKGKLILFVAASAALLAGSFAALSYVRTYSQSIEPSNFRSFAVSGEGKVVAKPDIAEFTFSIISQGGKEIAKLQKENTERTNRAISLIKEKGIDASDIKTESYSVEPRYQYYSCQPVFDPMGSSKPCPPAEITGYTITQTISVKVRNFDVIGDVVSGVVSAGANSVSQLTFTVDDPAALENQARTEAIQKAEEKAKEIARAGHFRLGRLLSIDEGGYYPPMYLKDTQRALGMGGEAMPVPAPSIEPGTQDIRINITLRYEIE